LPRRCLIVMPGRGRDCWPVSIRPTNGPWYAPCRHIEDICCSSGTLGILLFMAKWTLGILDSWGWGVDGVTTICGRDWTGLYSCHMLRAGATMDYWTQRSEQNQTTADIWNHEQISKVLQFNSPLNKQVLDIIWGESTKYRNIMYLCQCVHSVSLTEHSITIQVGDKRGGLRALDNFINQSGETFRRYIAHHSTCCSNLPPPVYLSSQPSYV